MTNCSVRLVGPSHPAVDHPSPVVHLVGLPILVGFEGYQSLFTGLPMNPAAAGQMIEAAVHNLLDLGLLGLQHQHCPHSPFGSMAPLPGFLALSKELTDFLRK